MVGTWGCRDEEQVIDCRTNAWLQQNEESGLCRRGAQEADVVSPSHSVDAPTALPCALQRSRPRTFQGLITTEPVFLLFYRKDKGEEQAPPSASLLAIRVTLWRANQLPSAASNAHRTQFIPPKRRVWWALGREDWFSSQSESHSIHLLQSMSSICSREQWRSGHRPHLWGEEKVNTVLLGPARQQQDSGTNIDFSYLRQL